VKLQNVVLGMTWKGRHFSCLKSDSLCRSPSSEKSFEKPVAVNQYETFTSVRKRLCSLSRRISSSEFSLFGQRVKEIFRTFISSPLKCYYDQILYTHFFTFSYTAGLSKISCQILINFPSSKCGLRIGENDVIFSKIPQYTVL